MLGLHIQTESKFRSLAIAIAISPAYAHFKHVCRSTYSMSFYLPIYRNTTLITRAYIQIEGVSQIPLVSRGVSRNVL